MDGEPFQIELVDFDAPLGAEPFYDYYGRGEPRVGERIRLETRFGSWDVKKTQPQVVALAEAMHGRTFEVVRVVRYVNVRMRISAGGFRTVEAFRLWVAEIDGYGCRIRGQAERWETMKANLPATRGKDPSGTEMIAAERWRQIREEGYDAAHDDRHDMGELAMAAAAWALPHQFSNRCEFWPWEDGWEENPDESREYRVRELVKAGALIAAEIDRLQRLEPDK